ncbi:MAG: hypothetical protein JEZ11_11695 [Desulfobacterales bacterium]|nr:hypothetical protein [Desulfobacterales bacterium]
MNTQKIAITIPKKILKLIDDFCKGQGISRSRYISNLLQEKLEDEKKRLIKDAYDNVFADEIVRQEQLLTPGGIRAGGNKG